jgi:hypothetical protein
MQKTLKRSLEDPEHEGPDDENFDYYYDDGCGYESFEPEEEPAEDEVSGEPEP